MKDFIHKTGILLIFMHLVYRNIKLNLFFRDISLNFLIKSILIFSEIDFLFHTKCSKKDDYKYQFSSLIKVNYLVDICHLPRYVYYLSLFYRVRDKRQTGKPAGLNCQRIRKSFSATVEKWKERCVNLARFRTFRFSI